MRFRPSNGPSGRYRPNSTRVPLAGGLLRKVQSCSAKLPPQQVCFQKPVFSAPNGRSPPFTICEGQSRPPVRSCHPRIMMTLKSALEDLTGTTLRAISGILGKLQYVSDLRAPGGSYQHWGLARVHGEIAAQRALTQAHQSLVSQLLQTPLRKLLDDVQASSSAQGVLPSAYLENLYDRTAGLLPPNPAAASARHLNSVLHALSSLEASRRHSIPQA
jgi:hypothetical protein